MRYVHLAYSFESRGLESSQRAQENEQAIEALAPRVKSLAELLRMSVSDGDTGEEFRRERLGQ